MTPEEIIQMARQAGVDMSLGEHWSFFIEELEAFAKLVAAKEREACAKIADAEAFNWQQNSDGQISVQSIAAAIRARGEA